MSDIAAIRKPIAGALPGSLLASVRGRIGAAFGLLLVTLAVIVGGAAWLSWQHQQASNEADRHSQIGTSLSRARLDGTTYVATVLFYMATGDEVILLPADGYHRLADEAGIRANALLLAEGNEAGAATVTEMTQDLRDISLVFDTAIARRRAGDTETASTTMTSTVPRLLDLESKFERLAGSERRLALDLHKRADELGALAFWLLVLSGGVGVVLGFAVATLIAGSILRPLSALESAARAVAIGDLAARAPEGGPRELARLGASLNQMTEAVLDASKRKQLEEEREQARTALQRRLEQLQAIYSLTDHLARAEDEDAIYQEALSCVVATLRSDRSAILLFDDDGVMRFKAWRGLSDRYRNSVEGHSPWSAADKSPVSVLITDIEEEPSLEPLLEAIREEGIGALAYFPLLAQGGLVGKLMIYYNEPHEFTRDEEQLAQTIARHVAFAITRRESEERVRQLAYHDELTGLPNRLLLRDRFDQALAHSRRSGQSLAIASLDLDRFKTINDTLGHSVGDALLRATADRLTSVLRATDTVARIGGDEFLLVLPGISHAADAVNITEKVVSAMRLPFSVHGHELHCTASVGVTIYPDDAEDHEALRRNADIAMYRAKESGRDTHQVYAADMGHEASWRLSVDSGLRRALDREQFQLHYQPIASTGDGSVVGVEALIRWMHPEKGLVLPDEFISLAEETGIILPLGEWVLRTACTQAVAWQEAGMRPIRIGVNISARQFRQPDLADVISRILAETGFDPTLLDLEITESAAMKNAAVTISLLERLVEMGIRISIDDFGTGYSSLTYLKHFPIHAVKIDRSFIREISTDQNDALIAAAIITMAHTLDLNVVAEGVESPEQLQFLKDRDCNEYQGYLLARPMAPEEVSRFIHAVKTGAAPAGRRPHSNGHKAAPGHQSTIRKV
jgi:diguanylate cyclase (GGDEF)-like protein